MLNFCHIEFFQFFFQNLNWHKLLKIVSQLEFTNMQTVLQPSHEYVHRYKFLFILLFSSSWSPSTTSLEGYEKIEVIEKSLITILTSNCNVRAYKLDPLGLNKNSSKRPLIMAQAGFFCSKRWAFSSLGLYVNHIFMYLLYLSNKTMQHLFVQMIVCSSSFDQLIYLFYRYFLVNLFPDAGLCSIRHGEW